MVRSTIGCFYAARMVGESCASEECFWRANKVLFCRWFIWRIGEKDLIVAVSIVAAWVSDRFTCILQFSSLETASPAAWTTTLPSHFEISLISHTRRESLYDAIVDAVPDILPLSWNAQVCPRVTWETTRALASSMRSTGSANTAILSMYAVLLSNVVAGDFPFEWKSS